jgi:hypothetical protein
LGLRSRTSQLQRGRQVFSSAPVNLQVYQYSTHDFVLAKCWDLFPADRYTSDCIPNDALSQVKDILYSSNFDRKGYFRPEFLQVYHESLSSDAFKEYCCIVKEEIQDAELASLRASKFLRESWIPGFVKRLDRMDLRPIDAQSLAFEMHRCGINIRYLGWYSSMHLLKTIIIYVHPGLIAQMSALPHIRQLVCIDMIGRVAKQLLAQRIRNSILHFKTVGATHVEDELQLYAATFFSTVLGTGPKSERYFHEKFQNAIYRKFSYEMSHDCFISLHKPAVFLSMQYHVIFSLIWMGVHR